MAAEQPAPLLRQAAPADAVPMVAMLREANTAGMLGIEPQRLDADVEADKLARLDLLHYCVLTAVDADAPVGFALAVRGAPPALAHTAVVSVVVDAAHRRRGLGVLLLEGIAAWARAAGVAKLCASVYGRNLAARALFTRAGYGLEGVRRGQLALADEVDDELWYALWPQRTLGGR